MWYVNTRCAGWSRWPSRPISSLRFIVTCTRIPASCNQAVAHYWYNSNAKSNMKCVCWRYSSFVLAWDPDSQEACGIGLSLLGNWRIGTTTREYYHLVSCLLFVFSSFETLSDRNIWEFSVADPALDRRGGGCRFLKKFPHTTAGTHML